MRIHLTETLAALVIVSLGVAVVWIGSGYSMGTLGRMGPGYFPVILGVVLILVGLCIIAEVLHSSREIPAFPRRPFLALSLGILSFAIIVRPGGLIPAVFALVMISAMGETPFRPLTALAIAAVMSIIGVVIFIMGLQVPLRAFWW